MDMSDVSELLTCDSRFRLAISQNINCSSIVKCWFLLLYLSDTLESI